MNRVTEQIIKLQSPFTGNITPISWYKNIRKDGKRHLVDGTAIAILSDIMYWYRPTEVRDESTGRLKGYKQKFAADKLQKSYQSYAELLGVPKSEVKRAIDNLVRLNLITREFRNIKTKEGLSINNVMFLEPILENIIKVSHRSNKGYGTEVLGDTPYKLSGTNTKITSENTTENTTDIYKQTKNSSKEKNINIKDSSLKSKSSSKKIYYNAVSGTLENISEEDIRKWSEAFPGVDVKLQIKRMEVWLEANPKKRKKNYKKFIVNWLGREHLENKSQPEAKKPKPKKNINPWEKTPEEEARAKKIPLYKRILMVKDPEERARRKKLLEKAKELEKEEEMRKKGFVKGPDGKWLKGPVHREYIENPNGTFTAKEAG